MRFQLISDADITSVSRFLIINCRSLRLGRGSTNSSSGNSPWVMNATVIGSRMFRKTEVNGIALWNATTGIDA